MRVTTKIRDKPTATRKSDEAPARHVSSCTIKPKISMTTPRNKDNEIRAIQREGRFAGTGGVTTRALASCIVQTPLQNYENISPLRGAGLSPLRRQATTCRHRCTRQWAWNLCGPR